MMTKKKTTWSLDEVQGWFVGRLPDGWFTAPPAVTVDRDEILVVGTVATPELAEGTEGEARRVAALARIKGFREDTRAQRMRIADEAELLWGRKVSWGARCDGTEVVFTSQAVPVMTRLRMAERSVLDTLIDAGVARSRSEALAWCVRLVGRHQADWIEQLRDAVDQVGRVRAAGPDADAPPIGDDGSDDAGAAGAAAGADDEADGADQ